MGEYELELISLPPALPAQPPLLTPLKVMNIMNRVMPGMTASGKIVVASRGDSAREDVLTLREGMR